MDDFHRNLRYSGSCNHDLKTGDFTESHEPASHPAVYTRRRVISSLLLGAGFVTTGNFAPVIAEKESHSQREERWLIIAAHPDDEAKAASLVFTERKSGDKLCILVMRLVGEGPPFDRRSWTPEEAIKVRYAEMERSAAHLNADELRWWLPPNPGIENIAKTPETVAKMAEVINELKPTRIITHWGLGDSHPDHAATGAIVKEVVKRADIFKGLKKVFYFDESSPGKKLQNFKPNYFTDISDPSLLASVLWTRCVHFSQVDNSILEAYLRYYKRYGQLSGSEYAGGFFLQSIP